MSKEPALAARNGRRPAAPGGILWNIVQHPGRKHLLIRRDEPQRHSLPGGHLSRATCDDYRQGNPHLGLSAQHDSDDDSNLVTGDTAVSVNECSHLAHAGGWTVTSIEPDWCEVGGQAVPFDSHADLGSPERASPNVKAQGSPVYAVSHLGRGVQGNVGASLCSGASGDEGYTQILSGQSSVRVNGLPVGRHDSLALINCDASGCGGALAQLHTRLKPVLFIAQMCREARKRPDDPGADMAYHRRAQADAGARANAIDRKIATLRAQADRISGWNPFNRKRRALGRQIEDLQALQRDAVRSVLWHNDQQRRLIERLYPKAAAGPAVDDGPTTCEAHEWGRRDAGVERARAWLEAQCSDPSGAASVLAGLPSELAQAIDTVAILGRRSTPMRPGSQPRPPCAEHDAQQSVTAALDPPVPAITLRPGVYVRPLPRTPHRPR